MYQTCPLCKGKGTFKKESCPVCLGEHIIAKNTGLPPSKYIDPYRGNSFTIPNNPVHIGTITMTAPQFVTYTK